MLSPHQAVAASEEEFALQMECALILSAEEEDRRVREIVSSWPQHQQQVIRQGQGPLPNAGAHRLDMAQHQASLRATLTRQASGECGRVPCMECGQRESVSRRLDGLLRCEGCEGGGSTTAVPPVVPSPGEEHQSIVELPSLVAGLVIGRLHANLNEIAITTGTRLVAPPPPVSRQKGVVVNSATANCSTFVVIEGPAPNVASAERQLRARIQAEEQRNQLPSAVGQPRADTCIEAAQRVCGEAMANAGAVPADPTRRLTRGEELLQRSMDTMQSVGLEVSREPEVIPVLETFCGWLQANYIDGGEPRAKRHELTRRCDALLMRASVSFPSATERLLHGPPTLVQGASLVKDLLTLDAMLSSGILNHAQFEQRKAQLFGTATTFEKLSVSAAPRRVHCIVDASNLFIGARHQHGPSATVNIPKLTKLLLGDLPQGRLCVGGSRPAAHHPVWNQFEQAGFAVHLQQRAGGEIFVDDMLHAQILQALLNPRWRRAITQGEKQTMILVSGDGNENEQRTTFPQCVERAVECGWRVQVWAWRTSLSSQFERLRRTLAPGTLAIHHLDDHFDTIVEHRHGDQHGGGVAAATVPLAISSAHQVKSAVMELIELNSVLKSGAISRQVFDARKRRLVGGA